MTHPIQRQKHYEQYDVQPIDFIVQVAGPEWCAGNIIKYAARYKEKNGVEDVYKAKHYCEMLINILEGRSPREYGKTDSKDRASESGPADKGSGGLHSQGVEPVEPDEYGVIPTSVEVPQGELPLESVRARLSYNADHDYARYCKANFETPLLHVPRVQSEVRDGE